MLLLSVVLVFSAIHTTTTSIRTYPPLTYTLYVPHTSTYVFINTCLLIYELPEFVWLFMFMLLFKRVFGFCMDGKKEKTTTTIIIHNYYHDFLKTILIFSQFFFLFFHCLTLTRSRREDLAFFCCLSHSLYCFKCKNNRCLFTAMLNNAIVLRGIFWFRFFLISCWKKKLKNPQISVETFLFTRCVQKIIVIFKIR